VKQPFPLSLSMIVSVRHAHAKTNSISRFEGLWLGRRPYELLDATSFPLTHAFTICNWHWIVALHSAIQNAS
jgi:hypothetical protein